jgi:hypothetical protein
VNDQPTFFDLQLQPVVDVQHDPNESLDTRFRRWLDANPHVLDAFVTFALQAQRSGRQHFGAKAIVERLRWEYAISVTGSEFKFDNNMTSRLARAAVGRRPELESLFEFRELRSV